jgi:mannose-6-phosphate isomerase-like protein (cupin superfamily)
VKVFRLTEMTKGWFVGDFSPAAYRTQAAEVAVKTYVAGTVEKRHVHRVAPEVTLILHGRARMNASHYESGDIVLIEPGESTDFEALTDVTTVVVKVPSVAGDKYEC